MKKIDPSDIVAFAAFGEMFPVQTDPVYAKADHPENAFGQVYHTHAQIWGHRDLVKIVLLAAKRLHDAHGWVLTVKDCLRPVEAQAFMIETPVVKAHPHWLQEPRFLSGPGQGGHPRGMAVDLDVAGVDFGTSFDHFADTTDRQGNPAHREYAHSSQDVLRNRTWLEEAMIQAAKNFGLPMLPLPQEWWDFRFPHDYTKDFAALSDQELLPYQKIVSEAQEMPLEPDVKILEELRRFV